MHHVCLRATNRERICLPFGKVHFIIYIINVQTSSLQIICRGQGTLGKGKNSFEINLFCRKVFDLDLGQGFKLMLSAFASHTSCTWYCLSDDYNEWTRNVCISRVQRNS